MRDLLTQLDTLVGSLDSQKAEINRAIDSIDRLAGRLAAQRDDIATALDQLPGGLKVLADQRKQLTTLLTSLDRLGDVGSRVIRASKDDTVANLGALKPVLKALNDAGDDLPKSLQLLLTYPFPDARSRASRATTPTCGSPPTWTPARCWTSAPARAARCPASRGWARPAAAGREVDPVHDPRPARPVPRREVPAGHRTRRPDRPVPQRHDQVPGAAVPGTSCPAGWTKVSAQPTPAPTGTGGGSACPACCAWARRSEGRRGSPGRATAPTSPGCCWGGQLMVTRGVRLQLVAFAALSLLAVSFLSARYVGLFDKVVGGGTSSPPTSPTPAASSPVPRSPTAA